MTPAVTTKSEEAICRDLAAELFATDPPTQEQMAIARSTFAFRFAVLEQRRSELLATIRDEVGGTWFGRFVRRWIA